MKYEHINARTHAYTRTHFVDLKLHTPISMESESNQCPPKTVEWKWIPNDRERENERERKKAEQSTEWA